MQLLWYLPSLVIGLMVGVQSGYWQVALMSLLMVLVMGTVSIFKNRYPNFDDAASVQVSLAGVALANRVLPRRQIFWKATWHQILFQKLEAISSDALLTDLLLRKKECGFAVSAKEGELRFWLGFGEGNEVELDLVKDGPHLLIVGPTGSGKSELLHLILTSALESQNFDLATLDFKGGATLACYQELASCFATDLEVESQASFWRYIQLELTSREREFADADIASIDELFLSGGKMKRILVVIDEFSAAMNSGPDAIRTIESIAARGRSLGVHLVAATQSLSGIARSSLTNLRTRIAMASSDPVDLVQLGVNPTRVLAENADGWASCFLVRSNQRAMTLAFPLGVRRALTEVDEIPAGEQLPPARSQLLRQMYLDQEPALDRPEEPSSSHDLQLLSRMAKLRS